MNPHKKDMFGRFLPPIVFSKTASASKTDIFDSCQGFSVFVFKAICCFILIGFFVNPATTAQSHPHAFVTTSYTAVFDDQGIHGIRVDWVLDEMYSASTAVDFDSDGDGSFSQSESAELVRLANESLPDFNFFTHIQIDGQPYKVKSVQDFTISYENGTLRYKFFVDCPIKASENWRKLKIAPYDKAFYFAMFLHKTQPLKLVNNEPYDVKTKVGKDKETLIYFDSIHPAALHLEFRKKK